MWLTLGLSEKIINRSNFPKTYSMLSRRDTFLAKKGIKFSNNYSVLNFNAKYILKNIFLTFNLNQIEPESDHV